jgi:hypothetical protein
MGERVTISYRGAAYELGRGKHSYGIWAAGAPRTEPVERWPETPEGWNAAWSRFAAIETRGSIVTAGSSPGAGISASAGLATALLGIGILCGIIGLFPGYVSGQSLVSQASQWVPHAIYLATWTLSAVLILRGGAVQRAGALLATGTSIVTFGLFFTDLGQVLAYGSRLMDAGMWFSLIGWVACAAGSVAACLLRASRPAATEPTATVPTATVPTATVPADVTRPVGLAGPTQPVAVTSTTRGRRLSLGTPGLPRGHEIARAVLLILAAIGVAIAFAPSWDSYVLRTSAGQSQTEIAGNAFSNPGWMIAGDLATMIAFVLVVIAAALWRPLRLGATLLAGAAIPMVAQAISAVIQVGQTTPSSQFGISSSEASAAGLTISNGVTSTFWIYCILLVVLVVSCAWMLITPPTAVAAPQPAMPPAPMDWATDDEADEDDEDDEDDDDRPVWDTDGEADIIDSQDKPSASKSADAWP